MAQDEKGGEPTLIEPENTELKPKVPDWSVVERDGIKHLERVFKFKNFAEALAFTNKVGEIAEAEGHHPAILTEWGRVTVTWWTHKIKGLHPMISSWRPKRIDYSRSHARLPILI